MSCSPSTNRLAVRRRADLVVSVQRQHGQTAYVLKDPLSLRYYRLDDFEYATFQMLNGRCSLEQIVETLTRDYPQMLIGEEDVRTFISSLYQNSLVIGDRPGQGLELKRRRDRNRQLQRKSLMRNVLAVRLPGFDPTSLLNAVYPWTIWFFSRVALAGVAVLAVTALCVLAVHVAQLAGELAAMHQYFGPGNWLLLALTLAATKILHEFGHAFACRRFGGECHEIGVMLLVLTPCLYCDVSDSWLLANRWHRAAIAAAGMYVEVTLASLATLIWANSEPSALHFLALQVMLICGASTLLFNGNPLARYDGYYILADLVDVPNLREEARAALSEYFWRTLAGVERTCRRPSWRLALFGVGVAAYRWVLLSCILWFLYHVLAAQGLEVVWQCMAASALLALVVTPMRRMLKELSNPQVRRQMKRTHVIATTCIGTCAAAFVFFAPLPCYVYSPCELSVAGAVPVYAPRNAQLEQAFVVPGQQVETGAPLATLTNLDLQLETARLESATRTHQMLLDRLKFERFENPQAEAAAPQAEELLTATRQQLDQRRNDRERMQLTAARAGVVLVPKRRQPVKDDRTLAVWNGSPLDAKNLGVVLAQGDVVCEIGDPGRLEAVLVVDQANVERLHVGQRVEVVVDSDPWRMRHGQIVEIARHQLDETPESLSVQAGGGVASRIDQRGIPRPISTSYTVRVPLEGKIEHLTSGLRGTAKIRTGSRTLASRAWQTLCRTFHFGL